MSEPRWIEKISRATQKSAPSCAAALPNIRTSCLVAEANRAIARHVGDTSPPIAGTHVRIGQPADVVLDLAESVSADPVVIGAHGDHVLERVLGTTASKIVHRAKCSVLVARPSA